MKVMSFIILVTSSRILNNPLTKLNNSTQLINNNYFKNNYFKKKKIEFTMLVNKCKNNNINKCYFCDGSGYIKCNKCIKSFCIYCDNSGFKPCNICGGTGKGGPKPLPMINYHNKLDLLY